MTRMVIGAAATAILGSLVAVMVSLTALGGWTSAKALPPATLGGTCIFSQTSNTYTLTANCVPTSTLVIPANKIINGNGKTIDGSSLPDGSTVMRTAAGSSSNQVWSATINVPNKGVGIQFNGPGGTIQNNTVQLDSLGGSGIVTNGGVVTVSGNKVYLGYASRGIFGNRTALTVTGNTVQGIGSDSDASVAIMSWDAGVTISGNTANGMHQGITLLAAKAASIKGNTLTNVEHGIESIADIFNAGPVTIMNNTILAERTGIVVGASCGLSQNNDLIKGNAITRLVSLAPGDGILLDGCGGGGAANIQGTTISWNTLTGWSFPAGSDPIDTNGAPFTLVNFNTIVG